MKNWRILIIVAGILALISIFVMYISYISDSDSDNLSIPAGAGWYYFYEFYLPSGGTVDVDYQEVQSTSVTVYLLDSTQYHRYVDGQTFNSIYSYIGSSGEFSETVGSSGKYYLVFTHGVDSMNTSQSVNVDFKINGFDIVLFIIGLIVLIVAIGLAIYGLKLKKEDRPPWQVEVQKESDVVMFDREDKG